MDTGRLFYRYAPALSALLSALLPAAIACAQDTPRTAEPPAVTAERDAQLAAPPSWGPVLNPPPRGAATAAEPEAARAKRPARPDPDQHAPANPPQPEVEATPTPTPSDARARALRAKRRNVDQVLTPTPRIRGSAAPAEHPVLTYGPALQARPPAAAPLPERGTVPATCSGAACFDAGGQRLNGGVGNALTTPQGQLCTRGLVGVQCF